jgi:hypothetical protein
VHEVFDWRASTDARDADGGTSLRSIEEQLAMSRARLDQARRALS